MDPIVRRLALAPSPLRRRALLASAAVAAMVRFPALAQGRVLRLGCTLDNSSVEKANGAGTYRGIKAFFNGLNQSGGIAGQKVDVLLADDQFKPELAKANALAFAADRSVVALMTPLGTRQTAAVMGAVTDMAIVGPITGTSALRKSSPPNLFWVRASYDQEVDKLIRTAVTLGTTRIGIVYPDDPLGKSVMGAFERSMAAAKLTPTVVATTPGTTSSEVEPAAKAIAAAAPQVVIMVLAGVAPLFVKALRAAGGAGSIYGLSISASASNIEAMGDRGRGVGFTIVVPSPFAPKYEIVRRYQADMIASGSREFSLPSLEGYIAARTMAEGLKRAGSNATREALVGALERIERLDLGGITIGYGPGNRIGSQFVDVAVIGAGGRVLS